MKLTLLIAGAAFIFGLSSAYASIQIFDNIHVDSEKPNSHWYDSFIFTLSPAGLINKALYGPAESLSTYEDGFDNQDVIPVMLRNGLGWMVIILSLWLPILCLRIWRVKSLGSRFLDKLCR